MDGNFLGDAMFDGLQLRKLSRDTLHSRRSAEKTTYSITATRWFFVQSA